MSMPLQGSLFDDAGRIGLGSLRPLERRMLHGPGDPAWVDVLPGWLTGADILF
jgi:hypothetical protein